MTAGQRGGTLGSPANSARSGLRDLGQVFISLSLKWESEVILYSLILPPTPKFSTNGPVYFMPRYRLLLKGNLKQT